MDRLCKLTDAGNSRGRAIQMAGNSCGPTVISIYLYVSTMTCNCMVSAYSRYIS
jgi:hypothetical protein